MNQRKVTSRFYGFESVLEEMPGFAHLTRRRSIADLQLLAGIVWKAEGGRGKCPLVRTRERCKDNASFYVYDDRIVHLHQKHKNFGGLLHELAHALGPHDKLAHGPAFRRRCLRLYQLYGEWNGRVDEEEHHGNQRSR